MLLPDILSYDPRAPVQYPHNGRSLTDDVAIFSSQSTRTEKSRMRSDRTATCWNEFPYLGRHTMSQSENGPAGGKTN